MQQQALVTNRPREVVGRDAGQRLQCRHTRQMVGDGANAAEHLHQIGHAGDVLAHQHRVQARQAREVETGVDDRTGAVADHDDLRFERVDQLVEVDGLAHGINAFTKGGGAILG